MPDRHGPEHDERQEGVRAGLCVAGPVGHAGRVDDLEGQAEPGEIQHARHIQQVQPVMADGPGGHDERRHQAQRNRRPTAR